MYLFTQWNVNKLCINTQSQIWTVRCDIYFFFSRKGRIFRTSRHFKENTPKHGKLQREVYIKIFTGKNVQRTKLQITLAGHF